MGNGLPSARVSVTSVGLKPNSIIGEFTKLSFSSCFKSSSYSANPSGSKVGEASEGVTSLPEPVVTVSLIHADLNALSVAFVCIQSL